MRTLKPIQLAILVRLFHLGRADRPASLARLARDLGVPHDQVAVELAHLDAQQLVDQTRVRLTMSGLCVAASARKIRVKLLAAAA